MVKSVNSKKARLLADPDIKRWFDNVSRGSENTAEVALRRLSLYCDLTETTPKGLLKLNGKKNFELLCDMVSRLQNEGKKGSYIDGIRKAVLGWLDFNGKRPAGRIRVKDAKISTVATKTPEPHEVLQTFGAGTSRTKVSISLVGYTGLRPESLGDLHGEDGLRLGDFPELALEPEPHFTTLPARVIVRATISKAGHQYFSYLNGKGSEAIISYLKERKAKGEYLTKQTPLIRAFGMKENGEKRPFLCTPNVTWEMKRAIRRAGFNFRPYDLRSFFDTQLLIAENRGKIAHDFRVFWMGHSGTIEAFYTTNRQTLSETMLKEMQRAYTESSPFLLQTFDPEEIRKEFEEAHEKETLKTRVELLEANTKISSLTRDLEYFRTNISDLVKEQTEKYMKELWEKKNSEFDASLEDQRREITEKR